MTAASAALVGGLLQGTPAIAAAKPVTSLGKSASKAVPDPDKTLGSGWKTSSDRAVTLAADTDGVHLLVADSRKTYTWKDMAVLSEPGTQADTWIGNECVMDHAHAAVAYAPRTFTNHEDLMERGAFTAIVDLDSGHVTKLPLTASLAYFSPSCNPSLHEASFTALRGDKSRLVTVSTAGRTVAATVVAGQITSAVPLKDGSVAGRDNDQVHISRSGKVKNLASTDGTPDVASWSRPVASWS
jgi:hypothetical protein